MDTTAHRRRAQPSIAHDIPNNILYQHNIIMHPEPPVGPISIQEFEEVAMERLKLLRILEQASVKGHRLFSDEWHNCVRDDLLNAGLRRFVRLMSGSGADFQSRRIDHISHYILRIAYGRSEDLRRWFIARELEWIRLKLLGFKPHEMRQILRMNGYNYEQLTDTERDQLRDDLVRSTAQVYDGNVNGMTFYKVHFAEVDSLVKNRRVYIKNGYAYVVTNDLIFCVQSKIRALLSQALTLCQQRMHMLDDERISDFLQHLNLMHTEKSYNTTSATRSGVDHLNIDLLDTYATRHFPPCMRHLHQSLRTTHHLKHASRLQYGLFLKAIGVVYEDAMRFWRDEFLKVMDEQRFNKEYAYNISHSYGRCGKRLNYSPFSCIKVIGSSMTGMQHGCPFRNWDGTLLRQKLEEYGVRTEATNTICGCASGGHYQIACTKFYEATHGIEPTVAINHPNQYFEESIGLVMKTDPTI